MGKIISVVNQKGGVGKTTTTVNLAAGLGIKGKTVLIVDADPQGNSSSGVGINRRSLKASCYDVLIGKTAAAQAIVSSRYKNLDILPCNMDLAGAEIELTGLEKRESMLKNALSIVRHKYDFIFIDCPPSLGLITLNSLCASDSVLIPIQCEYYAMEGLAQLIATVKQVKRLYNPHIDIEGIVLTMFDGRLNLTQQVVAEIKRYFADKLFKTVIPRTVRLSEAPSFGQPVQYYDSRGKGSVAYNNLASEFIKNNRR